MAMSGALLGVVLVCAGLPPDVGIDVISRPGVPLLSATLALPRGDVDEGHLVVVAAVMSGHRAFAEGPVAALRRIGGTVVARATSDGLLVTVEAPADERAALLAAIDVLLAPFVVDGRALVDAQAAVLRARRARAEASSSRAVAASFAAHFGDDTRARAPDIDDIALHRLAPEELTRAIATLSVQPGRVVVVEGRDDGVIVARPASASAPRVSSTRPRALPESIAIVERAATPRVVVSWPVPGALALDDAQALALCAAIEDTLQPLGSTSARVVGSARAALVVVEVTGASPPAELALAVRARLATFRDTADAKSEARVARRVSDELAMRRAPLGETARSRAASRLAVADRAPLTPEGGALSSIAVRALVAPDALLVTTISSTATTSTTTPSTP